MGIYLGTKKLDWWINEGQYEDKKKQGRGGLCDSADNLRTFIDVYSKMDATSSVNIEAKAAAALAAAPNVVVEKRKLDRVVVGCDFGSTTAKAVCLGRTRNCSFLATR